MPTSLITPEVKGAITSLAGIVGLESALGALSNKICKHQSFTIKGIVKVFQAISTVANGIAETFVRIQNLGGEVFSEIVEEKSGDPTK